MVIYIFKIEGEKFVKIHQLFPDIKPNIVIWRNFFPDSRFSSSGREDVDVRMLGRGRPFLFELVNPRQVHLSQDELTKMQQSINESTKDVFVRDLQIVSK